MIGAFSKHGGGQKCVKVNLALYRPLGSQEIEATGIFRQLTKMARLSAQRTGRLYLPPQ